MQASGRLTLKNLAQLNTQEFDDSDSCGYSVAGHVDAFSYYKFVYTSMCVWVCHTRALRRLVPLRAHILTTTVLEYMQQHFILEVLIKDPVSKGT